VSRGEVWWVELDPAKGSEATKRRPAVIVGRDVFARQAMHHPHGTVTVVPITTNVERVYDFQVFLPAGTGGLARDSKAQAEQIRTVSVGRLNARIGVLGGEISATIDDAIRLYLGL